MFRLNLDEVLGRPANALLTAKAANPAKAANEQLPQKLAGLATLAGLAVSNAPANEPFPTLDDLLRAAMLACDYHNDNETARQQMREDCAQVRPEYRQGWIDHFTHHYRKEEPWKPTTNAT